MLNFFIVFLTLISSLTVGFFGRFLGFYGAGLLATSCLILTFFISIFIFYEVALLYYFSYLKLVSWISSKALNVDWGFMFDSLTAIICFSGIIYLFSSHDNYPNKASFFFKEFPYFAGILDSGNLKEISGGDPVVASVIVLSGAVVIFVTRLMADRARHNISPEPIIPVVVEGIDPPEPLPAGVVDERSFDLSGVLGWRRVAGRDGYYFEWLFNHFDNDGMDEYIDLAIYFTGANSITVAAIRELVRRVWTGANPTDAAGILQNLDGDAFADLPLLDGYPFLAGFTVVLVSTGAVVSPEQGFLLLRFFINFALQRVAAREGVGPAGFLPERNPFNGFE